MNASTGSKLCVLEPWEISENMLYVAFTTADNVKATDLHEDPAIFGIMDGKWKAMPGGHVIVTSGSL